MFFHEALGERGELCRVLIGEPDDAPVFQNPLDHTVQGSAQGLDPIACLKVRRLDEITQGWSQTFPIEYASNVMCRQRGALPPPYRRQLRKYGIR